MKTHITAVRTLRDGESVEVDGVRVTVEKHRGRGDRYRVEVRKPRDGTPARARDSALPERCRD